MPFDQGQFDFESGSEAGYRRWRERLETERRAFEKRWGVVLGRRVRVQLRDHDRPLEGSLALVSETKANPPRFRIGSLEFTALEIESVVAVGDCSERS